jgi:hypothetical protein
VITTTIATKKSVKQIGAVPSTEKGSVVTMAVAVSTSGKSLLFFKYPLKNYGD